MNQLLFITLGLALLLTPVNAQSCNKFASSYNLYQISTEQIQSLALENLLSANNLKYSVPKSPQLEVIQYSTQVLTKDHSITDNIIAISAALQDNGQYLMAILTQSAEGDIGLQLWAIQDSVSITKSLTQLLYDNTKNCKCFDVALILNQEKAYIDCICDNSDQLISFDLKTQGVSIELQQKRASNINFDSRHLLLLEQPIMSNIILLRFVLQSDLQFGVTSNSQEIEVFYFNNNKVQQSAQNVALNSFKLQTLSLTSVGSTQNLVYIYDGFQNLAVVFTFEQEGTSMTVSQIYNFVQKLSSSGRLMKLKFQGDHYDLVLVNNQAIYEYIWINLAKPPQISFIYQENNIQNAETIDLNSDFLMLGNGKTQQVQRRYRQGLVTLQLNSLFVSQTLSKKLLTIDTKSIFQFDLSLPYLLAQTMVPGSFSVTTNLANCQILVNTLTVAPTNSNQIFKRSDNFTKRYSNLGQFIEVPLSENYFTSYPSYRFLGSQQSSQRSFVGFSVKAKISDNPWIGLLINRLNGGSLTLLQQTREKENPVYGYACSQGAQYEYICETDPSFSSRIQDIASKLISTTFQNREVLVYLARKPKVYIYATDLRDGIVISFEEGDFGELDISVFSNYLLIISAKQGKILLYQLICEDRILASSFQILSSDGTDFDWPTQDLQDNFKPSSLSANSGSSIEGLVAVACDTTKLVYLFSLQAGKLRFLATVPYQLQTFKSMKVVLLQADLLQIFETNDSKLQIYSFKVIGPLKVVYQFTFPQISFDSYQMTTNFASNQLYLLVTFGKKATLSSILVGASALEAPYLTFDIESLFQTNSYSLYVSGTLEMDVLTVFDSLNQVAKFYQNYHTPVQQIEVSPSQFGDPYLKEQSINFQIKSTTTTQDFSLTSLNINTQQNTTLNNTAEELIYSIQVPCNQSLNISQWFSGSFLSLTCLDCPVGMELHNQLETLQGPFDIAETIVYAQNDDFNIFILTETTLYTYNNSLTLLSNPVILNLQPNEKTQKFTVQRSSDKTINQIYVLCSQYNSLNIKIISFQSSDPVLSGTYFLASDIIGDAKQMVAKNNFLFVLNQGQVQVLTISGTLTQVKAYPNVKWFELWSISDKQDSFYMVSLDYSGLLWFSLLTITQNQITQTSPFSFDLVQYLTTQPLLFNSKTFLEYFKMIVMGLTVSEYKMLLKVQGTALYELTFQVRQTQSIITTPVITGVLSTPNETYSLKYDSISIRQNATHYELSATYQSTSTEYLIAQYQKALASYENYIPIRISGGFEGTRASAEEYIFSVFYDIQSQVQGILSLSSKSGLQSDNLYQTNDLEEYIKPNQSINQNKPMTPKESQQKLQFTKLNYPLYMTFLANQTQSQQIQIQINGLLNSKSITKVNVKQNGYSPNPNPINPDNSTSLFWMWILIAVVVLAIIVLVIFYICKKKKNPVYEIQKDSENFEKTEKDEEAGIVNRTVSGNMKINPSDHVPDEKGTL